MQTPFSSQGSEVLYPTVGHPTSFVTKRLVSSILLGHRYCLIGNSVSLTMAKFVQLTAAKKSGQQTEGNVKSRARSSSIPRPRAVMSSPGNLHYHFKKAYNMSAILFHFCWLYHGIVR